MNINEIYEKILESKNLSHNNYLLFKDEDAFYGTDANANPVFVLESNNANLAPQMQATNELRFLFNIRTQLKINDSVVTKTVHILVYLATSDSDLKSFIRLTKAFRKEADIDSSISIRDFFSSLITLFSPKQAEISNIELQGLFAELYTIYYFNNHEIKLNKFWHSEGKMKFDFSLSDKKRLEVKSTVGVQRIHHFKHEQLISYLYDIYVISYLLRRSDTGLSLQNLIEKIYEIASDDYKTLALIEKYTTKIKRSELENIRFDENYLLDELRFIKASNVPKFNERQPDGVFNAEYDSDLTVAATDSLEAVLAWMRYK